MDEDRSIKAPISDEPPRYGSIQPPPTPTDAKEDRYKVYPGRFYVLAVFAILTLVQSFGWLTFGTIPRESYQYFGLTDNDITILAGILKRCCQADLCG